MVTYGNRERLVILVLILFFSSPRVVIQYLKNPTTHSGGVCSFTDLLHCNTEPQRKDAEDPSPSAQLSQPMVATTRHMIPSSLVTMMFQISIAMLPVVASLSPIPSVPRFLGDPKFQIVDPDSGGPPSLSASTSGSDTCPFPALAFSSTPLFSDCFSLPYSSDSELSGLSPPPPHSQKGSNIADPHSP